MKKNIKKNSVNKVSMKKQIKHRIDNLENYSDKIKREDIIKGTWYFDYDGEGEIKMGSGVHDVNKTLKEYSKKGIFLDRRCISYIADLCYDLFELSKCKIIYNDYMKHLCLCLNRVFPTDITNHILSVECFTTDRNYGVCYYGENNYVFKNITQLIHESCGGSTFDMHKRSEWNKEDPFEDVWKYCDGDYDKVKVRKTNIYKYCKKYTFRLDWWKGVSSWELNSAESHNYTWDILRKGHPENKSSIHECDDYTYF